MTPPEREFKFQFACSRIVILMGRRQYPESGILRVFFAKKMQYFYSKVQIIRSVKNEASAQSKAPHCIFQRRDSGPN